MSDFTKPIRGRGPDGTILAIRCTDDGSLIISSAAPGALIDGTLTCTAVAVPLTSNADVNSVLVQADPDNSQNVFVGNSASQSVQLAPGGTETIPVNQPSKIYVRAASDTQRVNFHAVEGAA